MNLTALAFTIYFCPCFIFMKAFQTDSSHKQTININNFSFKAHLFDMQTSACANSNSNIVTQNPQRHFLPNMVNTRMIQSTGTSW